ncbi:MAG: hypothetical protein U0936_20005 [Planctomycetaceae bacterium]
MSFRSLSTGTLGIASNTATSSPRLSTQNGDQLPELGVDEFFYRRDSFAKSRQHF